MFNVCTHFPYLYHVKTRSNSLEGSNPQGHLILSVDTITVVVLVAASSSADPARRVRKRPDFCGCFAALACLQRERQAGLQAVTT